MLERDKAMTKFLGKAIAKAIESEELAALHYRRLAEIVARPELARRLLGDAAEEGRHASALGRAAARDGITVSGARGWGTDLDPVHRAFESCAQRGDVEACLILQDVVLEAVSIELYEVLVQAASRAGALATAALVDKAILPDERRHFAAGLRAIERALPSGSERAAAFERASRAILPALRAFAEPPAEAPCARTCDACSDRCLKLDACDAGVSLAGGWERVLATLREAARRSGAVA
jgi:hypothetical protein